MTKKRQKKFRKIFWKNNYSTNIFRKKEEVKKGGKKEVLSVLIKNREYSLFFTFYIQRYLRIFCWVSGIVAVFVREFNSSRVKYILFKSLSEYPGKPTTR